jgi:hypothetical protein
MLRPGRLPGDASRGYAMPSRRPCRCQASLDRAGALGLQRASEMLSFHHATTITDWGDIFVEGKMVFEGHSTVEPRVYEGVKKYYLGL